MTHNGETYYYHVNGHGDVMNLTDSSGAVVAEYEYDAWGNIISQSGTMASENPHRYAGYYYDEETGLYYLNARYYDAEIGRFITRDTFQGFEKSPQSLNKYAYCIDNPVNMEDSSGYAPEWSNVRVGRYTVKARFQRNLIQLSLRRGSAKRMLLGNPYSAYVTALYLKSEYKRRIGSSIGITTRSMAIEILGHVMPDAFATALSGIPFNWWIKRLAKRVASRTKIVDIGTWRNDNNRWLWDIISDSYSWNIMRNLQWVVGW